MTLSMQQMCPHEGREPMNEALPMRRSFQSASERRRERNREGGREGAGKGVRERRGKV